MRTAIEAIVARVPAWAGRSPVVRTLPGHAREQVFAVAVDGHEYVVRRSSDTELLGLSPANAVEATSRAADLGVGPPLAAVVDRHTLITEMVAGSVLVTEAVADRLEPVVRALRRLHRSAPLQASFPVHRVVEWHARDAGANEAVVPTSYERLHQLSRRIESTFARSPMNPVPCHNNLVPANVLFDDARVWLVDFECGGNNDVFFDLANLSVNCGFDEGADVHLLELYFGSASAVAFARLRLMKLMSEFREGMWGIAQRAVGLLDADAVEPVERLRRCERAASRPEVDQWLVDAAGA